MGLNYKLEVNPINKYDLKFPLTLMQITIFRFTSLTHATDSIV